VALGKLGIEVRIMMPRYRGITSRKEIVRERHDPFHRERGIFQPCRALRDKGGDYHDNLKRFAFFCREALALAKAVGFKPISSTPTTGRRLYCRSC